MKMTIYEITLVYHISLHIICTHNTCPKLMRWWLQGKGGVVLFYPEVRNSTPRTGIRRGPHDPQQCCCALCQWPGLDVSHFTVCARCITGARGGTGHLKSCFLSLECWDGTQGLVHTRKELHLSSPRERHLDHHHCHCGRLVNAAVCQQQWTTLAGFTTVQTSQPILMETEWLWQC